jgi:Polyketide cyclase / dehydrase and lipid transport
VGDGAWEMTHSVDADVSAEFAWRYWTDIRNWDDPPAKFELEGPFAVGTQGITRLPGQEPLRWSVREATAPEGATIEMPLDGAVLSFQWRFAGRPDGGTRITQRVALTGENANAYLPHASAFAANMPGGMKKIAARMAAAEAEKGRDHGHTNPVLPG